MRRLRPREEAEEVITTEYEYDANENLTLVRHGEATSGRDPDNVVRYLYDERDLLFRVIRGEGSPSATTEQYDHDGAGNRIRFLRAPELLRQYQYDSYGRLVRETDPMGNTREHSYDPNGNLVSETVRGELADTESDPADVEVMLSRTTYEHDAMDRLYSVTGQPTPVGAKVEAIERQLAYSDASQVVREVDANGHETRYAYDAANRLVLVTDALGNTRTLEHDAGSNLVRDVSRPASDPTAELSATTYAYDSLNRRVQMADKLGNTVRYAYDARSNLTEVTNTLGDVTRFTYDGLGRLVESTDGNRNATRYAYDSLDRIASIADLDGDGTAFEYDGLDRVARRTLPNGIRTTWTYDDLRRPTRTLHEAVAPAGAKPVDDRGQAWDAMYRLFGRRDLLPEGITQRYTYDALHRLIASLTSPGVPGAPETAIDYQLDAAGNRLSVSGGPDAGAYSLDPTLPEPGDFQVSQYTTTPFDERSYDRDGSLIAVQTGGVTSRTLAQDYAGRLVEARDPATGGTARYGYDALGRLISTEKSAAGAVRALTFRRWGSQVIEEEEDGSGAKTGSGAVYVYSGPRVGMMRRDGDADGVPEDYYALVETYRYGDFGEPSFFDPTGRPLLRSRVGHRILFDDKRYESATGYYYSEAGGSWSDPRAGDTLRRGTRPRESDGLVFNVVNPWAARLAGRPVEDDPLAGIADLQEDEADNEIQEGGKNDGPRKLPGTVRCSHICFKRGTTKSKAFFNWVASAVNREVKRMGGKIALCKREGAPVLEWTFEKGWPCRYEGPRIDSPSGGLSTNPDDQMDRLRRVLTGGWGVSPGVRHQSRSENPSSQTRTTGSDKGWGSCFNCHPFGLESKAVFKEHSPAKDQLKANPRH